MICRILFAVMLALPVLSHASHLKGGYIREERISETSLHYRITLHIFASLGGVSVGNIMSTLDFGDGQRTQLPELIPTAIDEKTGIVVYSVEHTYAAPATYTISYSEPNRNDGLINLPGSLNTPFYIETLIVADHDTPNYASPDLLTTPIFTAPLRSEYTYGISAVDRHGNTLVFEAGKPRMKEATLVNGYTLPENFRVNPYNGLVSWDTRYMNNHIVGEYLFNIRIFQFDGNVLRGYMTLEFTVIVEDVPEQLVMTHDQQTDVKNRIYVADGTEKTIKTVFGSSAETDLEIKSYSDINASYLSFSNYDSASPSTPIIVGKTAVRNAPEIVRDNPYTLTVRGTSLSGHDFHKDITFLIFSKDIDLTTLPELPDVDQQDDDPPGLQVYPNPFSEILYLHWPSDQSFNVALYSATGQLVYRLNGTSGGQIDTSSLSSGMYFYLITDGRVTEKGKLIKHRN